MTEQAHTLDARGLNCPLPIVRTRKAMAGLEPGEVLEVVATDPGSVKDMAYPPFILASTAAALGWEVSVFFTFYGLGLLKRDLDLKITPLGNPAMPMKLPDGPDWVRGKELPVPTALMSLMPGFESMATGMMRKSMSNKGVASIEELRALYLEADVNLFV